MNKDLVIKIENLSKKYVLGSLNAKTFIKNINDNLFKSKSKSKNMNKSEFFALNDINLNVKRGEILGIIGQNGAGKSTLLKILSRITSPTHGEIKIKGRISSLLEVGTGFHPELTGKENIFLNGTILGMSYREIQKRLNDIISFSEIEQFIDTPVKRYSSGMRVRLGFAVAAHLNSEIMVIDEVLAVGDIRFQKKCFEKMNNISKEDRTILFVSHNMSSIKKLCTRSIVLDNGSIVFEGKVDEAINFYIKSTNLNIQNFNYKTDHTVFFKKLEFKKIILKNKKGEITNNFNFTEDITIEIFYTALEKILNPQFWVELDCSLGRVTKANMAVDGLSPDSITGDGSIKLILKSLKLSPQLYTLNVGLRDSRGEVIASTLNTVSGFEINSLKKSKFNKFELSEKFIGGTPIFLNYEWEYENKKHIPFWVDEEGNNKNNG